MNKTMAQYVRLAQQGDQEAISQLYQMTYNSVYQSVRAIVKDPDEAQDLTQDSYLKGFQKLSQLDDPERFLLWMKRLASNTALDHLRKKRPVLFSDRLDENGEEIDLKRQDDCPDHMPEVVIDRQETARLLKAILGKLREEQRMTVVLFYYEDRTIWEIAQIMGCNVNTVKSRLKYARNKIEAEVKKLEKQGTKLYSLAPMPFFTWLVRMARDYGISLGLDVLEAIIRSGAAAGIGRAAGAGRGAAGVASKVSKAVGGSKALATKIVAGTLAVTVAAGAGAAAITHRNRDTGDEPDHNAAAHAVYEEFLGRYESALRMDSPAIYNDIDRFWNEVSGDILDQNPDLDLASTHSWELDYAPGEDLDEGIPVPDTIYDVNMNALTLCVTKLEDHSVRYAYCDVTGDGVDELFVSLFYRDTMEWQNHLDVYTVADGKLYRGRVDVDTVLIGSHQAYKWTLETGSEAEYVDPGIVYIHYGKGVFDDPMEVEEPDLDWQTMCSW